jgi:cold shock CspA family protein
VLHFDPPADAATYHHRSGRTARAGATGVVISLVDASMRKATRQLQQQIGVAEVIEPADPRRLSVHVVPVVPVATAVSTEPARPPRATASPATASTSDAASTVGTIKFFSPARGYGFIARPGAEDLFVHHTNISHKGAKATATLTEGQRVRYTIAAGRRGPEAVAVSPA